MYRTKNKISYLFALFVPFRCIPVSLSKETTQEIRLISPMFTPSFLREGAGGEFKTGHFDPRSTHLKFCPVQKKMRLIPEIFLLIFLGSLWLAACNSTETPQEYPDKMEPSPTHTESEKATDKQTPLILFFGNSLTAGYLLEMDQAFPALIQQKLDSLGFAYETRNSGLSGETSTGGNSRIEFVLSNLEKPLGLFVLELGANDGLRGIAPQETEKSLQQIIDKVKNQFPEVGILLCGMEAPPNMGEEFTNNFREIFPRLAEKNQTAFLPFLLDGVAGIPELNLPDGIHPTPEGHKIVAQNVWKALKPLIVE